MSRVELSCDGRVYSCSGRVYSCAGGVYSCVGRVKLSRVEMVESS